MVQHFAANFLGGGGVVVKGPVLAPPPPLWLDTPQGAGVMQSPSPLVGYL